MRIKPLSDMPCAGQPWKFELEDCPEDGDVEFNWDLLPPGAAEPGIGNPQDGVYATDPLPAGAFSLTAVCCVG